MKNESTFSLLISMWKFTSFVFENLEVMLIVSIDHFLFVCVLGNDNSNIKTPFFETVMRRRCVMLTETVKALLIIIIIL